MLADKANSERKDYAKLVSMSRNYPMLSIEEEERLLRAWRIDGDRGAFDRLVLSHLRLVAAMAQRYSRWNVSTQDLFSEGVMGLMQAIEKFDGSHKVRLATYARWWISANIRACVMSDYALVPAGSIKARNVLLMGGNRVRRGLGIDETRPLTNEDHRRIAAAVGITELDSRAVLESVSAPPYAIDGHSSLGSGDNFGIQIADTRENVETALVERAEAAHRKELLAEAMKRLNARERDIVRRRNLMETPETLESVARRYNISRERVRQIETVGIAKLSRAVREMAEA
jgi:RNA polymerase sigma-32 factor